MEEKNSAQESDVKTKPLVSDGEGDVKKTESQGRSGMKKILLSGLVIAGLSLGVYLAKDNLAQWLPFLDAGESPITKILPRGDNQESHEIKSFKSVEEFKEYLKAGEAEADGGNLMMRGRMSADVFEEVGMAAPQAMKDTMAQGSEGGERVSDTNVQVAGIDEPDILKTDGKSLFFSGRQHVFRSVPEPMIEPMMVDEETVVAPGAPSRVMPPLRPELETKVIDAFPPADLEKISSIPHQGNLLLSDEVLVVFSGRDVYGYDVSNPASPSEKWHFELDSRTRVTTSRLKGGKIYLVTQTGVNRGRPCPIPLINGGLEIRCSDIYYPDVTVPVDVTYTALVMDVGSGEVSEKISLVGSSGTSVVYMSPESLYISYSYFESMVDLFYGFYDEVGSDLIEESYLQRIKKLKDLEISARAKMVELETIIEEYRATLTDDERLRVENEMQNRMDDYFTKRAREFEKTGIVRIKIDGMRVAASGTVPGQPLNQFSLDEYEDNLRVATTTSGNRFGSGKSVNDVYVLSDNLKIVGEVLDLGLTERIYSARFIEDKGYVVTFRQIDPFYVIDLSDPKNPELKGELKIPGYSSYLHPIDKDLIVGIGKEGAKVKISLFDVSDPQNPREKSKYMLDEGWSDILNTHHAFLLDKKHRVFFLPGSKGGYVMGYAGEELGLRRAVSDVRARRAVFIDDYLYVVGDDKIVVLNENDWTEVNKLDL